MFLKLYLLALPIFFAFDMVWLGVVAKNFYRAQIGGLMKTDVNFTAAIIFYLIYIFGLVLFVIAPAVEKHSWMHALLYGMLFGFVCYATYDLTNLAIAKDWPLLVTIVDLAWGTVLGGVVSVIAYVVYSKLGL